MANFPQIAVAVRTFGNSNSFEGLRVKAGTRFAVGAPQGGLKQITVARYQQLKAQGLMRGLEEADAKAAPAADMRTKQRPTMRPLSPLKADAKEPAVRRPSPREAARRKQQAEPPAPRPLNTKAAVQGGSPAGTDAPASSSAADPALNTLTSKPRGTRRG